jgi:hypothetical protein
LLRKTLLYAALGRKNSGAMHMTFFNADTPEWLLRRRKIPVREAAEINNISEDTFKRRYSHLIKKISLRREVVELGDALDIGSTTGAQSKKPLKRRRS